MKWTRCHPSLVYRVAVLPQCTSQSTATVLRVYMNTPDLTLIGVITLLIRPLHTADLCAVSRMSM